MSEKNIRERDILALAEGQPAILIGRGWEAPGYWRWEKTRHKRMVRAYYDTSNPRRVVRISSRDLPELFRPLRALPAAGPSPAAATEHIRKPVAHLPLPAGQQPPALEAPFDIGAALAAFEARLLLALRVDDALPDRERGMLKVRTWWPATVSGAGDYPSGIATRFRPTRRQIDDWFALLSSLKGAQLEAKSLLVLRLRARGFSFRSIGSHERILHNESRTRAIYRAAVAECWRATQTGGAGGRPSQPAGAARR